MPIYTNSGRRSVIPDFYKRNSILSDRVKRGSLNCTVVESPSNLLQRFSSSNPDKRESPKRNKDNNPLHRLLSWREPSNSRNTVKKQKDGNDGKTELLRNESDKATQAKEKYIRNRDRKSDYQRGSPPEACTLTRLSMFIKRSSALRRKKPVMDNEKHDLAFLCQLLLIKTVSPSLEDDKLNLADDFNHRLDEGYFEYYPHIFRYLCIREQCLIFNDKYLSSNDFSVSFRCNLVDWLIKVQVYSKIQTESLQVAVTLLDMFTSLTIFKKKFYQLIGVASLLVACKVVQRFHPSLKDLCNFTDNCYLPCQVLQMEKIVLEKLDFMVNVPIASHFHHRGLLACVEIVDSGHLDIFCSFMFDLILLDPSSPGLRPSCKAAGAIIIGRFILYPEYSPWTKILHHYTLYSMTQLKDCVKRYVEMLSNIYTDEGYHFKAVLVKYCLPVWQSIAKDRKLVEFSRSKPAQDRLLQLFA